MANTKSAKKRIRSNERRQRRNRYFKAAARTYVKGTRALIREGRLDEAEAMSRKAISTLDKAARKGIIHPRNASRRKGRLMQALARAQRAAA